MAETIILSVGGSLIAPDLPDVHFLKNFKTLIEKHIKQGRKFIIITGGGRTCRNYQEAASKVSSLTMKELDELGIEATRLNGHLMQAVFKEHSENGVVENPTAKIKFGKKILIAAGWKPGCSTDYDAVLLAKNLKAKKIINLTNVDHAYTKDPRKHTDAKPIDQISWKEFRKIVGDKWVPGMNAPFDPIASKAAEKLKITVCIVNGKDIPNLDAAISGKKFLGSVIQ